MLAEEGLLCKCHKPVTRHRSRAQNSYGAYYFKCYKGSKPGSCNFFQWEQLPSPPPSPIMASTRRDGNQEPTTPSRTRAPAYTTGNPAVDSPRRIAAIKAGIRQTFGDEEEEEEYVTPSTTPMVTPRKRVTAPTKRTLFSDSPTKSSNFSQSGERALVRAATEGDLSGQLSREELLKLLETKNEQIKAKESIICALRRELEAVRAENAIFVPESPVSLPSSGKGKGRALDFSSPPRVHESIIVAPEPTSDAPMTVQSHFSIRSPTKSTSDDLRTMWN